MKIYMICLTAVLSIIALPLYSQNNPGNVISIYQTGRALESQGRTREADIYYNDVVRISLDEIYRTAANRDTYTAFTWALQRLAYVLLDEVHGFPWPSLGHFKRFFL